MKGETSELKVVYIHKKSECKTPFYVGIGDNYRPYRMNKSARSKLWWKYFQKYGCEVEILHKNLTKKEACKIEIELIKKYGRVDQGTGILVNHTDGGELQNNRKGKKHSQETIEKIRLINTGKKYSKEVNLKKGRSGKANCKSKPVRYYDKEYESLSILIKKLGWTRKKGEYRVHSKKHSYIEFI